MGKNKKEKTIPVISAIPKKISKKDRTIIKCEGCGFKYYEGDVHKCKSFIDPRFVGVVNIEEKEEEEKKGTKEVIHIPKVEKKGNTKTKKESFKIWKDF